MSWRRSPFPPDGDGYRLALREDERALLERVLPGFRDLLLEPEHADLRRLFPPAHPDDERRQEEWDELMSGQLLESRFDALDVVQRTLDAERLDPDQLAAWARAINAVRLVLGTRLDVSEDDPSPSMASPAHELYAWLSWLLDGAVQSLSGRP